MPVYHGDRNLFDDKRKKSFNAEKFRRTGKNLENAEKRRQNEKSRVTAGKIVAAATVIVVVAWLLWPSGERKKIEKRTRSIFACLSSKISVLDLPGYLGDRIKTKVNLEGYHYRKTYGRVELADEAKKVVLAVNGIKIKTVGELFVKWSKDNPDEAVVEGEIDATEKNDASDVNRVKFRFNMQKDKKRGWVLTDLYVVPSSRQ